MTEEELVSSDILGESHASIADLKMTRVVGGNLVKERTVLIAPQKIVLIDSSDKVIFETKI